MRKHPTAAPAPSDDLGRRIHDLEESRERSDQAFNAAMRGRAEQISLLTEDRARLIATIEVLARLSASPKIDRRSYEG